jgi:hypothetical protein
MTNFSSFFPVAAGGGGFTKMNKYVTSRGGDDATNKLKEDVSGKVGVAISGGGQTSFQWYADDTNTSSLASDQDGLVGYTFDIGYGTQTVTANAGTPYPFGTNQTLSFTPAVAGGVPANQVCDLIAPTNFTVNPSSDLGLSDGDSIGYMLVGGGYNAPGNTYGGKGGKIIYGTAIISNASTDLVLTPGAASGGNSTISGGLTLTSADGANTAGHSDTRTSSYNQSAGSGIMGYGVGGGNFNSSYRPSGTHGWGSGGFNFSGGGGDGAILLYY